MVFFLSNISFRLGRPSVPFKSGIRVIEHYHKSTDPNGNAIYVCTGTIDIQKDIDSYRDCCSLENLLARIQYMPVKEKIGYLQQTSDNVGADMYHMPVGGTAAYLALRKLKRDHPDFYNLINQGSSFDEAFKTIFVKPNASDVSSSENNADLGGDDNGTN